jgi:tetratricopeptide (TPR) repeat protein
VQHASRAARSARPPALLTPAFVDRATLALRVTCRGPVAPRILTTLDALLAVHPDAIDLRFARACLLDDLGRPASAAHAYDDLLARDPLHRGALINAATLAYVEGHTSVARARYARAVEAHPDDAIAHLDLGHVLADLGDAAGARASYEHALAIEPDHAVAHYALARLLDECGETGAAAQHRARAFAEPIVHVAPSSHAAPLRVLVPIAADGGNLVTTLFFDERMVETTVLVAESYDAGRALPDHDLIVNAVADADRSVAALDAVARIVAASGRPCINPPAAIRATGRAAAAAFLREIPGIVAPRTEHIARAACTAASLLARGFTFPLIVRAPGFHAGKYAELVTTADALDDACARLPGDELLVIAFIDTLHDGVYCKYRMLIVDGELLPLHLAIASHWLVHYFRSDNARVAAHRVVEAAYLADPRAHLGPGAYRALEAIRDRLGLDYGGIDFALDAAGNVVVFEANATFAIYLPDDDATAAYRLPVAERAVAAVRAMIAARATRRPDAETPPAR